MCTYCTPENGYPHWVICGVQTVEKDPQGFISIQETSYNRPVVSVGKGSFSDTVW